MFKTVTVPKKHPKMLTENDIQGLLVNFSNGLIEKLQNKFPKELDVHSISKQNLFFFSNHLICGLLIGPDITKTMMEVNSQNRHYQCLMDFAILYRESLVRLTPDQKATFLQDNLSLQLNEKQTRDLMDTAPMVQIVILYLNPKSEITFNALLNSENIYEQCKKILVENSRKSAPTQVVSSNIIKECKLF